MKSSDETRRDRVCKTTTRGSRSPRRAQTEYKQIFNAPQLQNGNTNTIPEEQSGESLQDSTSTPSLSSPHRHFTVHQTHCHFTAFPLLSFRLYSSSPPSTSMTAPPPPALLGLTLLRDRWRWNSFFCSTNDCASTKAAYTPFLAMSCW